MQNITGIYMFLFCLYLHSFFIKEPVKLGPRLPVLKILIFLICSYFLAIYFS